MFSIFARETADIARPERIQRRIVVIFRQFYSRTFRATKRCLPYCCNCLIENQKAGQKIREKGKSVCYCKKPFNSSFALSGDCSGTPLCAPSLRAVQKNFESRFYLLFGTTRRWLNTTVSIRIAVMNQVRLSRSDTAFRVALGRHKEIPIIFSNRLRPRVDGFLYFFELICILTFTYGFPYNALKFIFLFF